MSPPRFSRQWGFSLALSVWSSLLLSYFFIHDLPYPFCLESMPLLLHAYVLENYRSYVFSYLCAFVTLQIKAPNFREFNTATPLALSLSLFSPLHLNIFVWSSLYLFFHFFLRLSKSPSVCITATAHFRPFERLSPRASILCSSLYLSLPNSPLLAHSLCISIPLSLCFFFYPSLSTSILLYIWPKIPASLCTSVHPRRSQFLHPFVCHSTLNTSATLCLTCKICSNYVSKLAK